MLNRNVFLNVLLGVVLCLPAFGAITIGGTDITFSDSTTQSTGAVSRYHVVNVTGENSITTNGNNLIAAIAAISDANWGQEYVILLDPGEYYLGTQTLTMKDHVTVTGMGQTLTRIAGSGAITIQGALRATLRSLTVSNDKTSGGTVYAQNGGETEFHDITLLHTGQGGGLNYGMKLTNGAGVELHKFNILYYFGGTTSEGTYTGIHLTGYEDFEGSWVDCVNGFVESSDDAGNMILIGIQVGDNSAVPAEEDLDDPIEVDLGPGTFVEVEAAAGKGTALWVLPDGEAFLNGTVLVGEGLADVLDANIALDNEGVVRAINSGFVGTLVQTGAGATTYAHCSKETSLDGDIAPINDTNPAVAP